MGRTAIPHVSIGGAWNTRLIVVDRRRGAIAIAFRASNALLSAVADHTADDSAAHAAEDRALASVIPAGDGATQQGARHTTKKRPLRRAIWVVSRHATGRYALGGSR
jgi:hypothetical protein